MATFLVVICLLGIYFPLSRTEKGIQVEHLGQVNRLNGSSEFTDVYFSCSLRGSFLNWQFNHVQLRLFQMGEVGRTFVVPGVDFNYTTTLLSSRPIANDTDNEALDSVLVVTFLDTPPQQFQVTCTSNNEHITRFFLSDNSTGPLNANGTVESVLLDFELSNQIVQNIANTYVFVCGVAFDQQLINASGPIIGFSSQDEVGKTKTHLSRDRRTTNVLGILIFRDSHQTTSLIFIPHDSEVEVVCSSGSHHKSLFTSTSSTTSTPALSTKENVPTLATTSYQSDKKSNITVSSQASTGIDNAVFNTKSPKVQGNNDFTTVPTRKSNGGFVVLGVFAAILAALCVITTLLILLVWFLHKSISKKKYDTSGESETQVQHNSAQFSSTCGSTLKCDNKEEDGQWSCQRESSKPEVFQNGDSHSVLVVAKLYEKETSHEV